MFLFYPIAKPISAILDTLLEHEEEDPASMASFVHQAHVRRDVVVELIEDAQARGHRSYRHVSIAAVRKKAEQLPEDGIPPEIVRLLPHDASLDKILIQKAAAPVDGRGSLETAGARLDKSKPNAVVEEQSGCDDADINAQRIAAVRSFAERLTGEQQIITMDDSTSQEARASRSPQMLEGEMVVLSKPFLTALSSLSLRGLEWR